MSTTAASVAETRVHYVPLLVEIETEACKDESKERHEDGDGDRTAVGGAVGFGVGERNVLSHAQTCDTANATFNQRKCKTETICRICIEKKNAKNKIERQKTE